MPAARSGRPGWAADAGGVQQGERHRLSSTSSAFPTRVTGVRAGRRRSAPLPAPAEGIAQAGFADMGGNDRHLNLHATAWPWRSATAPPTLAHLFERCHHAAPIEGGSLPLESTRASSSAPIGVKNVCWPRASECGARNPLPIRPSPAGRRPAAAALISVMIASAARVEIEAAIQEGPLVNSQAPRRALGQPRPAPATRSTTTQSAMACTRITSSPLKLRGAFSHRGALVHPFIVAGSQMWPLEHRWLSRVRGLGPEEATASSPPAVPRSLTIATLPCPGAHQPGGSPQSCRLIQHLSQPTLKCSLGCRRWLLWLWAAERAEPMRTAVAGAASYLWLAFPFRGSDPCSAIGLAACCVANHLLGARQPDSANPIHLRAASSWFQLPARAGAIAPACGWPARGAAAREGYPWSWAGVLQSACCWAQSCAWLASSTVSWLYWSWLGARSTPAADTIP